MAILAVTREEHPPVPPEGTAVDLTQKSKKWKPLTRSSPDEAALVAARVFVEARVLVPEKVHQDQSSVDRANAVDSMGYWGT